MASSPTTTARPATATRPATTARPATATPGRARPARLKYGGLGYPVSIEHGQEEPSLASLREHASDAPATRRLIEEMKNPRPPLTRPDGSDPDGFAVRVADAYREYVMETRSPALKIAEEAGVPVATARSWIREARRRGKLPSGRRGRAG